MNEVEFAYRVRQALNEGAERLDYKAQLRLQNARQAALARQKPVREAPVWVPALRLAAAGAGPSFQQDESAAWLWFRRLGIAGPMIALVIGFVAVYQWRADQKITELADLDFAVLLDDTPIETYADKGFGVMLRNEEGI
ncbi:MAG TPA: DUF3619 family protein [Burkholderiaceae bacterium]